MNSPLISTVMNSRLLDKFNPSFTSRFDHVPNLILLLLFLIKFLLLFSVWEIRMGPLVVLSAGGCIAHPSLSVATFEQIILDP